MAVFSAENLDGNYFRDIRFQVPESEEWIATSGEIAWMSKSKRQAGIRFNGLSETARNQLRAGISLATTRASRFSANAGTQRGDETAHGKYKVPRQSPEILPEQNGTSAADGAEELAAMSAASPAVDASRPDPSQSRQVSTEHSGLEEFHERASSQQSDAREPAMDFSLSGTWPHIEPTEQALSSSESKNNTNTQVLDLPERTHQEIPDWVSAGLPSVQLPLQKISPAELLPPHSLSYELATQPTYAQPRMWNRYDTGYHNWVAVTAVAFLAALMAFLFGWIIGDPSTLNLGR